MYENIGIIEKNGRRLIIDMAKYRGGFFWFDLTLKKPLVMFREFAIPATKVPETVAFCDENGIPWGIIRCPGFVKGMRAEML